MSDSAGAKVLVIERNSRVGRRIARTVTAASGLANTACLETASELELALCDATRLIACGEDQLDEILFRADDPRLRFIVWTSEGAASVLRVAADDPRISNVLGWPSYHSMPRAFELCLAVRRLTAPDAISPALRELVRWGATAREWSPRTTIDRDDVVAEVVDVVLACGAAARTAQDIGALAYELIMNAMFVAPVDRRGRPRYAFDRGKEVVLDDHEVPSVRLVTDGMLLGVEVCDGFGRLQRQHVFEGIVRALDVRGSVDDEGVVDASGGGAGLGIAKVYAGCAILVFEVTWGRATRVLAIHDLDASPREMRGSPTSVHYFWR